MNLQKNTEHKHKGTNAYWLFIFADGKVVKRRNKQKEVDKEKIITMILF